MWAEEVKPGKKNEGTGECKLKPANPNVSHHSYRILDGPFAPSKCELSPKALGSPPHFFLRVYNRRLPKKFVDMHRLKTLQLFG